MTLVCTVLFTLMFKQYDVLYDDFHIDAIKSEIGKRNIKYKGSKLWNDLPAELKETQSLKSFKYYLLQSLAC